jgi:HemK-related putative methylase
MLRGLYRRGLGLFSRWHYRKRYRHLVIEYVHDKPFVVLPDVFNPVIFRSGGFLVAQLPQHLTSSMHVLDMGTGSGVGAIFAAQIAAQVTATDINPEAVRCTRMNALLNKCEDRVCVVESDLFAGLSPDVQYDVVLFNPPYFRGEPHDLHDHAWRSVDTVERFAAQLPERLTAHGFALMVLSTDGETPAFLHAFHTAGLSVQTVATRDYFNEIMRVYRLEKNA